MSPYLAWFPKTWNDILALVIIAGGPLFLATLGTALPEVVVGTLATGWALVCQFYFRRAPVEGGQ